MSIKNPSPEQLHNHSRYTLLAEVDYLQIKSFIVEVLQRKTPLLLVYGIFQMLSVAALGYFVAYYLGSGNLNKFFWLLGGIVFSFTLLIPAHELLHALAFKVLGKSNIGFGAQLKKFIFYAEAHRQVVNRKEITIVALTPLLVVGIICSLLIVLCYNQPAGMVALGIVLIHPMFCGGDLAIVAYFKKYAPLQMYSYDDRELKKTYYFIENEATSL